MRPENETTNTLDAAAKYFEVLVQALKNHSSESDRPPTASRLRILMGQLTNNEFNLQAIGYPRFRDFLEAAERTGLLSIDRSYDGDLRIFPNSDGTIVAPFLREDLWKAIIDWSPNSNRYWDVDLQIVQKISAQVNEPNSVSSLDTADATSANDGRFIPIPKITADKQLSILRTFTADATVSSDDRLILLEALKGPKPFKRTIELMRSMNSSLEEGWSNTLRSEAWATLTHWIEENPKLHGLDPSLLERKPISTEKPSTKVSAYTRHERLRTAAHDAINRMSLDQLMSLNFPLGVLLKGE